MRLAPALDRESAQVSICAHIADQSRDGGRGGLASNMHEALKASEHRWISFRFDGDAKQAEGGESGAATLTLTGNLTIAAASPARWN